MSDIPWKLIQSTNIKCIRYTESNKELFVVFHGRTNYVYIYKDIPAVIAKVLSECDIPGAYLNRSIKGKFLYTSRRLEIDELKKIGEL